VTLQNEGIQDSTPIIEHLEVLHREPSIHPTDPVSRFVSILLEEFGDEWGNKWMFHYRWAREVDQLRRWPYRALDAADGGRGAARQRDRDGSRSDGQSWVFRRLESRDCAAN
jgi:hypothetical protein